MVVQDEINIDELHPNGFFIQGPRSSRRNAIPVCCSVTLHAIFTTSCVVLINICSLFAFHLTPNFQQALRMDAPMAPSYLSNLRGLEDIEK